MKVLSALRSSYSTNDIRLAGITSGLVLNGKYANTFDNIKVVRFEEVLLNGAEAELMPGGDPAKALLYYKAILSNRLTDTYNQDGTINKTLQQQLDEITSVTLANIYQEKKKEFVGEGHGMFDLLRRGQGITQRNTSGAAVRVRNVGDNLLAFPIPRAEINVPGSLVVQNPSYSN